MTEANVADVLVDACRWANVATEFRTVAGEKGRLKDLSLRIVVSLICYGLNLGASQTERSVRLVSRKQVAWLNQQYVTEETLDRAIVKVINCFNQFQLPKYWGSGMSASADGKKWNIYEQNLISERHIRYGGYGGLGYYHVSDRYIALMAHFTTCGTYEAIHILDGLLKNASEIQPDTVHGDTQSQSYPVFALAYLLGIKLMPRIRDLGDCSFSRAEPKQRYSHINALMDDAIKWDLIEEHLPEMMRIAVSIKAGLLTSSSILRRLGTQNRKNPIYFAFVELGKVIRTLFLLDYVDDMELRKTIHRATNKSEQFNGFMRLVFFGGEGVVAENMRHEQQKLVKWAHLAANLIILHNVNEMTRVLRELEAEGYDLTEEAMAGTSPFRMGHLNRLGVMLVDSNRQSDPSNAEWQPKSAEVSAESPTLH
jgi:TnpA family transposase